MSINKDYNESNIYNFPNTKKNNILFNEENNIIHTLLTIKRKINNNQYIWEIIKDKKIIYTLYSQDFSKKELQLLKSAIGLSAILKIYKNGKLTLHNIKTTLNQLR